MIYSNSDRPTAPPGPKQGPNSPPPQTGGQPPAYGNSRGYPQVEPYAQVYSGYAVVMPRQTAGQRFIRAFLVATFIWLLFSMLVHSSIRAFRWGHRHGGLILDGWDYTVPPGVDLEQCVQGGEWSSPSLNSNPVAVTNGGAIFPYESETSFDLPISSETLFFLSRGHLLGGLVDVVTSTNQAQDSATVQVVIKYRREEIRDLVKACLVSRNEGENGVGIFSPVWPLGRYPRGQDYHLSYHLTVTLPELTEDSAPLVIKNFETDVPNTAQRLEDLAMNVLFDQISLRGSNGLILAKSLAVTKGKVHTSNGAVTGIFNSTTTLTVETSNGPISGKFNTGTDLTVKTSNGAITGVYNTTTVLTLSTSNSPIRVAVGIESKTKGSTPTFNAHTSNGILEADVSLISDPASGGSFKVTTSNSNAPLRVAFPASPLDSKLDFTGRTSNGHATVFLNPAYEGSFNLQTSATSSVSVHRNPGVEDPSGKERKRQIQYRNIRKGVLAGEVYWDTKQKDQGQVNVRTSNAPVVLEV